MQPRGGRRRLLLVCADLCLCLWGFTELTVISIAKTESRMLVLQWVRIQKAAETTFHGMSGTIILNETCFKLWRGICEST